MSALDRAPESAAVADLLRRARLLPLVVIDKPEHAPRLARLLAETSLPVMEIALRTECAVAALRLAAREPGICVGAGTVLDPGQVGHVVDAGARFVVTPGTDWAVIAACRAHQIPVFPGAATATELQALHRRGLEIVKFFPAAALGGPAALRALSGVYPSLQFIPTGGISASTAGGYLEEPAVLAVGGSWMVPRDAVAHGDLGTIARLCRAAVAALSTHPEPSASCAAR
jgi:2-dehydro-3-deoxyphosphogluconate aldolase/(4S)-4-hydroxy-2-oxoglutarate aldolase